MEIITIYELCYVLIRVGVSKLVIFTIAIPWSPDPVHIKFSSLKNWTSSVSPSIHSLPLKSKFLGSLASYIKIPS